MFKRLVLGAVLALAIAGGVASGAPPPPDSARNREVAAADARATLVVARAQVLAGDFEATVSLLEPLVGTDAYAQLTDTEQHAGLLMLAGSYQATENWPAALKVLKQVTALTDAGALDWSLRLDADFAVQDYSDAATTLTEIARRWPDKLADVSRRSIQYVFLELRSDKSAEEKAYGLLDALYEARWPDRSNMIDDPSYYWKELTLGLLERGEIAKATKVAGEITSAQVALQLAFDRRFDPISANADSPDLSMIVQKDLARQRKVMEAHPNDLRAVIQLADNLIVSNRSAEALALLDAALERARSPVIEKRRFEDQDEEINWVRDYRARALLNLGRVGEALTELQRGTRLAESGTSNVSQVINLSVVYVMIGRPSDALSTLEDLDEAHISPYGWMNAQHARICAHAQMSNLAKARSELEAMRARAKDSASIMLETELCVGNVEEAARIFLTFLNDSDQREEALAQAQIYLPRPHFSDFDDRWNQARAKMLARADVTAAINKVGRVLKAPFLAPGF